MRDTSLRRRRCSLLQIIGALPGTLHSLGQSGAAGFGRQPHEPKHRGDLILVLLHAPVEGSAIFLTDQRLRRTRTLGELNRCAVARYRASCQNADVAWSEAPEPHWTRF